MRFAIVTPSFEQGAYIGGTLESVAAQQGDLSVAHFVQDGGSRDGTIDLLREHAERTRTDPKLTFGFESAPDDGQTAALNRGFSRVDGDILAWLNSDDHYEPGSLAAVKRIFDENPSVDVVYGQRRYIDEAGRPLAVSGSPFSRWFLERVDFIPQECVFWRKSIFEAVGGQLDESFQFCMDYELWIRFLHAGARFHYEPRVLANFRVHPASKTQTVFRERGIPEINRVRRMSGHGPTSRHRYFATMLAFRARHPGSRPVLWDPLWLKMKGY